MELVTFTCMTNTGAVLWIYTLRGQTYGRTFTNSFAVNDTTQLGVFTLTVAMISGNNLTTVATVSTSSLINITSLNIMCRDSDNEMEAFLVNGTLSSIR